MLKLDNLKPEPILLLHTNVRCLQKNKKYSRHWALQYYELCWSFIYWRSIYGCNTLVIHQWKKLPIHWFLLNPNVYIRVFFGMRTYVWLINIKKSKHISLRLSWCILEPQNQSGTQFSFILSRLFLNHVNKITFECAFDGVSYYPSIILNWFDDNSDEHNFVWHKMFKNVCDYMIDTHTSNFNRFSLHPINILS